MMRAVSFKMSFMAVVCLVGTYEWRAGSALRGTRDTPVGIFNLALRYLAGLVLTTLVAGLATAPVAAFHFNRISVYGVVANVAALPVMGVLVMPMAVLGLLAMPFGLETYPLRLMSFGLDIVLEAARFVADMQGAVRLLPSMTAVGPLMVAAGFLWLSLWRRTWRLAGLAICATGLALARPVQLPDVLVGAEGKLLAVKTRTGALTLSSAKTEKYTAERWQRKFGDMASLTESAGRGGITCDA